MRPVAILWLLVPALAGSPGCAPDTTLPDREEAARGGADLSSSPLEPSAGSCSTAGGLACGGPGEGSCYCDDLCEAYGDCCHDKAKVCDGPIARLRVPPEIPGDGATSIPIRVDYRDPGLVGKSVTLELDRPNAGVVSKPNPSKLSSLSDGWHVESGVLAHFKACEASGEGCLGPAKLILRSSAGEVLAEASFEIVAPRPEPTAAPCLGGGNVAKITGLTGYLNQVGPSTFYRLDGEPWQAAQFHTNYIGVPNYTELNVMTGGSSITIRHPALAPGVSLAVGTGSEPASVQASHLCGAGELFIHEIELGESTKHSQWVDRLTAAWRLTCAMHQGQQTVLKTMTGCVHYDRENPIVPSVN